MSILIEINTATMNVSEAHALAGFLDALYPGRVGPSLIPPQAVPAVAAAPAAPAPVAAPAAPRDMADALMAAESARVANVPAPPAPAPAPAAPEGAAITYPVKLPNGTEVDAEGLPWDKRIHSESKGLLKSGAWKLRRNIDEAVVAFVKNELRQAMSAPPAIPVAHSPAPAPANVPAPPAPVPAPAAPPAPAIQVEGAAPPTVATVDPSAFAAATFADLMSRVVDLSVAGTPPETINALCAQVGLSQPRDANVRPDLVPQLMALLATLG